MHTKVKWAILVLGMHRSGTSALANTLSLLGAELPRRLMPAHESNPLGHFEPEVIVGIHDKLLAAAGSSWSDWRKLPHGYLRSPECAALKQELAAAYEDDFGNSHLAIVKDPRMCRLVPLWEDILTNIGRQRWYVLQFRHPSEVVQSLFRRNGVEPYRGYVLWLRHLLDAEVSTRHAPRTFVRYESLLANPRSTLGKMVSNSPVIWGREVTQMMPEIELALRPDLRHNRADDEELADRGNVPQYVREVFECYQRLERDPTDRVAQSRLDIVRRSVDAATGIARVSRATKVMSNSDPNAYSSEENKLHLLRFRLQEVLASHPSELATASGTQSATRSEVSELRRQLDHRSARIGYLYAVLAHHVATLQDLRGRAIKHQDELSLCRSTEAELRSELSKRRTEADEMGIRCAELQAAHSAVLTELALLKEETNQAKASEMESRALLAKSLEETGQLKASEMDSRGLLANSLEENIQLKVSEMESRDLLAKSVEENRRLRDSLSERDASLIRAAEVNAALQGELADIQASTSWHVTAPLRWLKERMIQRSKA